MCVADLLPVVFYQRYVCDRDGKVSVEKQWAVTPIAYAYQACAQVHLVSQSSPYLPLFAALSCLLLTHVHVRLFVV